MLTVLIASDGLTLEFRTTRVVGTHAGYVTDSVQIIPAQEEIANRGFVDVVVLFFQIATASAIIARTLRLIHVDHFCQYAKIGVYVDAVVW